MAITYGKLAIRQAFFSQSPINYPLQKFSGRINHTERTVSRCFLRVVTFRNENESLPFPYPREYPLLNKNIKNSSKQLNITFNCCFKCYVAPLFLVRLCFPQILVSPEHLLSFERHKPASAWMLIRCTTFTSLSRSYSSLLVRMRKS